MMSTINTKRQHLDALYQELIDSLTKCGCRIKDLKTNESKLAEIKKSFIKTFSENVDLAQKQMTMMRDKMIWDHLVIAFFGETNAGKSTIIETFRIKFKESVREKNLYRYDHPFFIINIWHWLKKLFRKKDDYNFGVDGDIIGDGSPDFTKQYKEYQLSLGKNYFTLVDVPGIEGNEHKYESIVKEALLKAHCVFYVQGHNKQPDEATTEKIKDYLNEWVSVYSIYNVRSNADQYIDAEDRKFLKTKNVVQVEGLVQNTFNRILGKCYKGLLCTQGLLSLCAIARFSEKHTDLIKKQKKLLSLFKSPDDLWKFSNFDELVHAVTYMNEHYIDEIVEANKIKYIKVSNDVVNKINDMLQRECDKIESFRDCLNRFCKEINSKVKRTQRCIETDLDTSIDVVFNDLQEKVFLSIDRKENPDVENLKQMVKQKITKDMNDSIAGHIKELNDDILSMKKNLDNNDNLNLGKIKINLEIPEFNFDTAMDEIGIHWSDVFSLGGEIFAGFLVAGPFGGFVGGMFGLLKNFFGDGGKSKAKHKASIELDKAKRKMSDNIRSVINGVNKEIGNGTSSITKKLSQEMSNLNLISETIDRLKTDIKTKINNIKQTQYGNI